ncbi:hypothetical protein [uncultured Aquimarina sp.]|nr:hypothetical protein [uncultured Aquimarina sp.]
MDYFTTQNYGQERVVDIPFTNPSVNPDVSKGKKEDSLFFEITGLENIF